MESSDRLGVGRRRALAVVTSRYAHDELPDLESPLYDAELLRQVLGSPDLGRFDEVEVVANVDSQTARRRIFHFFNEADNSDVLFAYFSCHGRKDKHGELYLTTIDTDPHALRPTALYERDLRDMIADSEARQIMLVLDCCYAGALGTVARQRATTEWVALTAAGANQLAHNSEADRTGGVPSLFTRAFFDGITTGAADNDDNGWITVREAFEYAKDRVIETTDGKQSPQVRQGTQGDIVLSRAPSRPGTLTTDLAMLLRNGLPAAREVAVIELTNWLAAEDAARVQTAVQNLELLRRDPDDRVASRASLALADRYTSTLAAEDAPAQREVAIDDDPLWYKRAVFYEIRVRSYADSDGNGEGDLEGLTAKLGYLQALHVDCLVLAPIFDSPLHDDGYDASDFTRVHPGIGTTNDLIALIDAAHRRGIRVVLDFVLNHTSDEHEWFEQSRRDPTGPYGDFYVWSDTDELFAEARAATEGGEAGWTYDPVRKQYYWHRFGVHEPDLNFDNPAVRDALMRALFHWLNAGVDGFRLLTAPFLYERDGTSGEGLTETHDYLRHLRAEIDGKFPNRVLIAWTDHWPEEAGVYFGDDHQGNECGIVLYASLMPRVFLAMRQENRDPVTSLLATTPAIPAGCQWGIFLRNGDELSLDQVDTDQRAALLEVYAPESRMVGPGGIRRRLAPLLDGNTTQILMCHALLMSLPGAPVMYYGDEIGMGENLRLPGNAAIRTPMQWSPDRGGGFSDAEPEHFALPLNLSTDYGYQAVNVKAQDHRPNSLLQGVRRLVEIRKHSPALHSGGFRLIGSTNPAVLAYIRDAGDDHMLCVINFSRFPRQTRLDLSPYAGRRLVEPTGGADFGTIREPAYELSLIGHGFFWLKLENAS